MVEARISPQCVRAARAALQWDQKKLAEEAKVSRATLAKFENGLGTPSPNNLEGIRRAFELAGFTFSVSTEDNRAAMSFPETWK